MKNWWKPAGVGAFELGAYRVQKDWATNLWDIYHEGQPVKCNLDGAVEAMEEAEKLGA